MLNQLRSGSRRRSEGMGKRAGAGGAILHAMVAAVTYFSGPQALPLMRIGWVDMPLAQALPAWDSGFEARDSGFVSATSGPSVLWLRRASLSLLIANPLLLRTFDATTQPSPSLVYGPERNNFRLATQPAWLLRKTR
ncbi:hypothetical protein [Stenotrophomonas sp. SY1]|uniref:hypothetical protein n=1 Tax=Stenotrophomonas sp. SY1 TaxID=477235 RepID=UPI001E39ECE2|nr:hypothetical protein [Stenotrophomonas sp. SY1]